MAEAIGLASSVIAVIDLSAKVALLCLQYFKDVKSAQKDIDRLRTEATSLQVVSEGVKELLDGPHRGKLRASQQLPATLTESRLQLEQLIEELTPSTGRRAMKRFGLRALKWPFDRDDFEKTVQNLARYTQIISSTLQVDQMTTLLEVDHNILEMERKAVLDKLPVAEGAAFNSHLEEHNATCLPGTRVELLSYIGEWVEDVEAKSIFWLNGMAGTGKSTISRTVAQSYHDHGLLCANFFFKRGEGDRGRGSKFFTTLASQLVTSVPEVAPHVKNAIDADATIWEKAMRQQFEKLILEPLSQLQTAAKTTTLVIVVDALDECESEEDVRTIIHLFSQARTLHSVRLRIFATSRPELPIRLGFKTIDGNYQDFVLHEIAKPVIKQDLMRYFEHELVRIKQEYNQSVPEHRQLPSPWPQPSETMTLVSMAIPLFIFAATMCRFLADRRGGSPDTKLRNILEEQTKSQGSKLDATYLPVLNQMLVGLSRREKETALQEFRDIVGSIVTLESPLSISALERMLGISQQTIEERLDWLHSVLRVPMSPNMPIRLFHLSFRDFLLDPEKRESPDTRQFWVDEKEAHRRLAVECLRVMGKVLQPDICGVKWPGTPQASIESESINDHIQPEVQYACQYWVFHAQRAEMAISDGDSVHKFLQQHFLHWLEALSLLGRASESLQSIKMLQSLLRPESREQLSTFLHDAIRFVLANVSIIQHAPLQTYCSALVFAPGNSIIRQTFEDEIPSWILVRPKVATNWDNCLQTLEGHTNDVNSVAFSPDSKLLATGSEDRTVRIWTTDTGTLQQTLHGHEGIVRSVVFSPDSKLIASASDDLTVRLWATNTGTLLQTLEGHSGYVRSVVFSADSKLVTSVSSDQTIRLWATDTGILLRTLEGYTDGGLPVVLSANSKLVAWASYNGTMRLWETDTCETKQTFETHSNEITSLAFSPDSKMIAASYDQEVRLWATDTGVLQQTLQGYSEKFSSLAFSPDSKLVASGMGDQAVLLWATETGEIQRKLEGHIRKITSLAFSPDLKLIASASADRTVRLWTTDTRELKQTFEGHRGKIASVAFSPDSKSVVSASYKDDTARLWEADTGALRHVLKCHQGPVNIVKFLPNSKLVATVSRKGPVRLWVVESGVLQHTLDHTSRVSLLECSPDSNLVATVSKEAPKVSDTGPVETSSYIVQLWATNTGVLQHTLVHKHWVDMVVFAPDSKVLIVTEPASHTAWLWAADTGTLQQTLEGHRDVIASVTFSADSKLVATASKDSTVRLWAVDTGALQHTLVHDTSEDYFLQEVTIWANSKFIASADRPKRTVLLWAVDTGVLLRKITVYDRPGRLRFDDKSEFLLFESDSDSTAISLSSLLHASCGINVGRDWITLDGKNLLWLPVHSRRAHLSCSKVSGSNVAIGCPSGKIINMRFSAEVLRQLATYI